MPRPTRLDHFPRTKNSGDTLKVWLENHNLPVSKEPGDNITTMERATGGKA